jgi:hypothetical protein
VDNPADTASHDASPPPEGDRRPPKQPTPFTPELMDEICRRLAEGQSLREICRTDGMPTETAVRLWAKQDRDGCAVRYTQAREAGYERLADELLEIADDGSNDWVRRETERGAVEITLDHEHVSRSRLRVDTRKWMLSKMLPKVFGDRLQHANAAGDGDATVHITYSWARPEEPRE